jgi:hypothetical protein
MSINMSTAECVRASVFINMLFTPCSSTVLPHSLFKPLCPEL